MTEDRIKDKFPIGTEVMAIIYPLRHLNIWEPQRAIVHSFTSKDEIQKGYLFGIRVLYKDKIYWVSPEDVKEVKK